MSDPDQPSASFSVRRILFGITLCLVLGLLPALAIYWFANPHPVGSDQPLSERRLRPILVEVPISDIEENILRQRPAGFVIRAKRELEQSGHTRSRYFKYWDGSSWADYSAVAEIFPSSDLAGIRMKSCTVPQDTDSLEVVATAEVK